MNSIVHKAASRKGGKLRVKKGLGAMPPEKVKEIASMGGKASAAIRSGDDIQPKEVDTRRGSTIRLADIFGDINEEKL